MGIFSAAKTGIMAYWYWHVRKLTSAWPSITMLNKKFAVFPGVYKPLENEYACADYCRPGDSVLDLGCGSGVGAIFCAEKAAHILASDISPAAVANTRANLEAHGVRNVSVVQGDMFENVTGTYDLIIANPPYIAADFEHVEHQFATSVRYLPILFANLHSHLNQNGRLLVQYPAWFRGSLVKLAQAYGMELKEQRRMPAKSLSLALTSLLYLQVGFRSTLFLFEPARVADAASPQSFALAA